MTHQIPANLLKTKSLDLQKYTNLHDFLTKKYPLSIYLSKQLSDIVRMWQQHSVDKTGGAMRELRGKSIEQFVINSINLIGQHLGKNFYAVKGDTDKKLLQVPETPNISHQHQVDVHIYRNNQFVAVIECKAYLDKCYYTRACDDFKLFKKFNYNVDTFIFAMENSIADDSKIFTDFVMENPTTDIFYMMDGKRSSSKPIYDPQFHKEINIVGFLKFFNHMVSIAN